MIQKKFSIIIPTLNEQQGIEACLQTLQKLRSQAEIIIADGGSQDDTVFIVKTWVDQVIHTKKGRAKQMNAAAKCATGEILIFLHADTFLPDDALILIEQALSSDKQWGRFNISLIGASLMLKVIAQMMNWRSYLTGIATGDQAIFVCRALFEKIGGYAEIALMEDIALSRTLKTQGSPVCLKAKVKSSGRRWQQFGFFKTILLMWNLRIRYWLGQSPDKLAALYRNR
jgi:rSAM/selenodomain-associated transferase 2